MGFPENEVAAENSRRKMEETSKSPVGGVIENAVSLARPALVVASAVVATGAAAGTGLAVAGSVVAGLGIVDWFRKLGAAKVNENLESLGQATEDALNRVERVLLEHGTSIDKIKSRLNSQDFKDGMASAALQALRTTQADRLKRLALILANGVKEDDLGPEGLDDMMRAAVELKEADIRMLKRIYDSQIRIIGQDHFSFQWRDRVDSAWAHDFGRDERGHLEIRGSLSRLESVGFLASVRSAAPADGSLSSQPFGLLREGAKFYERLQETATKK